MAPQREWFEKDYYAVLGVPQGATEKEIARAVQEAREAVPPRREPGEQGRRGALQGDLRRATTCSATPRSARSTTRSGAMVASGVGPAAPAVGGGGAGGFGGGGRRSASRTSATSATLGDLFGNLFGGAAAARSARRRGAAPGPQRGAGPRDRAAPRLPRRGPRRHHVGALHAPTRRARRVPRQRARRRARSPRRARTCDGAGAVAVDQGPFSFSQVCPTCGGRGQVIPDAVPARARAAASRCAPREVKVRIPAGVDDGQRIRVKGRGARRAQRRSARRPLRGRARRAAPGLRPQRQATSRCRCRSRSPRPRSAPQVKVPTLDAPVTVKVPAGHAERQDACRCSGRGHRRARRAIPATCSSRSTSSSRASSTTTQQAAVEAARRGARRATRAQHLGV